MKLKALQVRNAVFCALVAIFAALVAAIRRRGSFGSAVIVLAAAFVVLAVALVIITAKLKEPRIRKLFFIITGTSAALIPICAIVHNLVYGLCMVWFGGDFWGPGGDEAVFFILAIIVCPALFVLGAIGSIVLLISAMFRKKES